MDEQSAVQRFRDTSLSFEERAESIVAAMTLAEKISQMTHHVDAIRRLGLPAYNWWNECLHGVARAGIATVFPQAIGMAASFDAKLMHRVAVAISDEARAKHHEFLRQGDRGIYKGLTFWSPNINIFRDPRWGRGHETYGEDPFLTGRMGVAFVKGLQGDDPRYLKVVATVKHFAVHSGPEPDRHGFDARVSQRDLRETYLPAFKVCIQEAKCASIMGAYNRTNGEPCCASPTLLQKILREEWGFKGSVVSDCGAIDDIHKAHKVTQTAEESAALAVKAGCDLNCGFTYSTLKAAVDRGLITEAEIATAVKRLVADRLRLGMFDPPEQVKYAQIPYEINDCDAHRALARKMAQESIVLLKNQGNLLPLATNLKSLAVVGPTADLPDVLLGNYNGQPSRSTTMLAGIRAAAGRGVKVWYATGSRLAGEYAGEYQPDKDHGVSEAIAAIDHAELAVVCLGLAPSLEGEEGDATASGAGGDKPSLELPDCQMRLLRAVCARGKPVVLVVTGGSAMSLNWAVQNVPAILLAWYPGEEGGTALADVLFGRANPAGRLPVTFVKSSEQLPPFKDYSMQGRTYRFMREEPLYRFGYGLSYTRFEYANLRLSRNEIGARQSVTLKVDVRNAGERAGDEVVQLYVSDAEASVPVPIRHLEGFERVNLKPGQTKTVTFRLKASQLAAYDEAGQPFVEPGAFAIWVGGGQPGGEGTAGQGATLRVV